jgi:hypothetical protein
MLSELALRDEEPPFDPPSRVELGPAPTTLLWCAQRGDGVAMVYATVDGEQVCVVLERPFALRWSRCGDATASRSLCEVELLERSSWIDDVSMSRESVSEPRLRHHRVRFPDASVDVLAEGVWVLRGAAVYGPDDPASYEAPDGLDDALARPISWSDGTAMVRESPESVATLLTRAVLGSRARYRIDVTDGDRCEVWTVRVRVLDGAASMCVRVGAREVAVVEGTPDIAALRELLGVVGS